MTTITELIKSLLIKEVGYVHFRVRVAKLLVRKICFVIKGPMKKLKLIIPQYFQDSTSGVK